MSNPHSCTYNVQKTHNSGYEITNWGPAHPFVFHGLASRPLLAGPDGQSVQALLTRGIHRDTTHRNMSEHSPPCKPLPFRPSLARSLEEG